MADAGKTTADAGKYGSRITVSKTTAGIKPPKYKKIIGKYVGKKWHNHTLEHTVIPTKASEFTYCIHKNHIPKGLKINDIIQANITAATTKLISLYNIKIVKISIMYEIPEVIILDTELIGQCVNHHGSYIEIEVYKKSPLHIIYYVSDNLDAFAKGLIVKGYVNRLDTREGKICIFLREVQIVEG